MDAKHVIHRHGMTEDSAEEVEAALIDAYPGLTNIQPGYDDQRASTADYVLAVRQGLIVGAFVADKWLPATKEYFPDLFLAREAYGPREGRYGILGREAPEEIRVAYCQKRLPEKKKGEANPIHYWNMHI